QCTRHKLPETIPNTSAFILKVTAMNFKLMKQGCKYKYSAQDTNFLKPYPIHLLLFSKSQQ
ncbi:hypothetical protein BOQ60_26660, partial [Chryseobacterium sp. CH1]